MVLDLPFLDPLVAPHFLLPQTTLRSLEGHQWEWRQRLRPTPVGLDLRARPFREVCLRGLSLWILEELSWNPVGTN